MTYDCPLCDAVGSVVPGEMVDVGVGMVKCSGDYCEACGWLESSPFDENALPIEEQRRRRRERYQYPVEMRCFTVSEAHASWIKDNVGPHPLGECWEVCAQMQRAFPELVAVYGEVGTHWGLRHHVWLHTPDGTVVDPTKHQYPESTVIYAGVFYPVNPNTKRRTDYENTAIQ